MMRTHRAIHTALKAAFCLLPLALLTLGCGDDNKNNGNVNGNNGVNPVFNGPPASRVVYTETNSPTPNGNAVMAFRQALNGQLTLINSFPTGGTGTNEPALMASGVLDTDKSVIVNSQHTLLFAVNQGSDTVAVFTIHSDGSLTPAQGSPFPSGGHAPVSLGLVNNDRVLVVLNSSLDPARNTSDIAPNYTSFNVAATGPLTPIANSTVSLPAGSGPSIALPGFPGSVLGANSTLLFGANFLGDQIPVLQVGANGVLTQASGSPNTPDPGVFAGLPAGTSHHVFGVGVFPNPAQRLVYFSFPLAGRLAVYSYDANGQLTFIRSVPNTGAVACWIVINAAANRLYTSNAVGGNISVFDIGTDPTNPRQIQLVNVTATPGSASLNGNPWHIALDPANQFLYLLTPRDLGNTPAGQGNAIHVFQVNADGTLTEIPNSTVNLNVPVGTSPQGLAVI